MKAKIYYGAFLLSLLSTLVLAGTAHAQSYILDWGSSFTPAWAAGGTNGTATNIGGSSINCTVTMAISGSGAFVAPYPRVNNNNGTTADFEVQSSSDAIEIDQNLGNRTSFSVTTLVFSRPVQNLQFGISDIDFPGGGTPYNYIDQVTVSAVGPGGAVLPVLTKYNPASLIYNIVGNVSTANSGVGGGNVSSLNQGSPDQDGTMFVDFGANAVTTVTIQYGVPNIGTVRANPQLQAIAIGNFSFLPVSGLPVSFTSFGADVQKRQVLLKWQTAAASNTGNIWVEKSKDGIQWQAVIGILPVPITTQTAYKATDKDPMAGTSYYRLKEITNNGEIYYSRIVRINLTEEEGLKLKTYPNPFRDQFNIELNWPAKEIIIIRLFNEKGQLIKSQMQSVEKGFQVIPITQLNSAGKGNYFLQIQGTDRQHSISTVISNQ